MDAGEKADEETLDRLNRTAPAMDVAVAGKLLVELKGILDSLGVVFFLRQGTCLGAVRDHAFKHFLSTSISRSKRWLIHQSMRYQPACLPSVASSFCCSVTSR